MLQNEINFNTNSFSSRCIDPKEVLLDANDEKCPNGNQVCCKNPDMDVELCESDKDKKGKPWRY